jgi:hypothetical protein
MIDKFSVQHWWNDDTGKLTKSDNNLSHCHFVHHKSKKMAWEEKNLGLHGGRLKSWHGLPSTNVATGAYPELLHDITYPATTYFNIIPALLNLQHYIEVSG